MKVIHALILRCDSMGYVKGEIEACLNGYRLYFRENIYPEASQMLRKAEEKLTRYDDLLVSARVYFYNGQFQARINNNDVALNYYLLSAEKCRELKDTKRLTRTYREIGIMMLENGNLTLARKYLWQAYRINLKAKNPSDLSGDMNSLGVFYMRLGKPDSAEIFYRSSYEINKTLGNPGLLAQSINNLASFQITRGQYDSAFTLLQTALSLGDSIRNKSDYLTLMPTVYGNLGFIFNQKKEYPTANKYLADAVKLAGSNLDLNTLIGITYQSLLSHRALQNYQEALTIDDRYHYLLDSSYRVNSRQNLMALEMRYNYAQLQAAEESRQIKLKLLLAGSAIASVLIILILILFLQKQRIKVRNSTLQQKILDDQLETRNRELASHVLNMVRVNERKLSLIETLREQLPNVKKENQQIVQKVIEGFETDQDAMVWKEFEIRFTEVHREFYAKLSKLNPNLTVNEKRLCAFLLLDMTTKEICSITGQSNRAIELARIRLRKQLGLTNQNVSLSNFLASL